MGLFGISKRKKENVKLKKEVTLLKKENSRLKKRGEAKDTLFKELMSDATRHGSSIGAKHMSDRKKYMKGK
ncbi:hypothetical protein AB6888_00405 [Carnobacterium maltaromaticum]|uniref:hypothetical protein n=1 Tax=Carnobacterium maltaromaticum TaxID=2751 RepID=UPI0039BE4629